MIGVIAAALATLGDLLLLATSNAARPEFAWLPRPSQAALLLGTYLGVLAIPCYGLGFRAVAARFDAAIGRPLVMLGVVGAVLGGTTHGLTGLVIHVERARGAAGVDPMATVARYGAYLLPLWAVIAVASIAGSALYMAGVLQGRSTLPRWMAFANPTALVLALAAVGSLSTTGEAFLVPAAPNLALGVFFALVALTARGAAAADRR